MLLLGCNYQHSLEDQNVRHSNEHKVYHKAEYSKKTIEDINLVVREGQLHDILVETVGMG